MSHAPESELQTRKISSAPGCSDPSAPAEAPSVSVPQFPMGLYSYIQDTNTRQTAEAYSLFLRQMQINSSLYSLTAPSQFGFVVPNFPSYTAPLISSYSVDFKKPDSSHQIFGGLSTNPQLQYLITPSPKAAITSAPNSLNAVVFSANLAPLPSSTPALQMTGGNNGGINAAKF